MSVGFRHWMIVISVLLLASQPVFLAAINHPTMAIALFTRQLFCCPIPPLDEALNRFFCRTTFTGDGKFRYRAPIPTGKSLYLSEILVLAIPTTSTV
jgi:hypothetical protein